MMAQLALPYRFLPQASRHGGLAGLTVEELVELASELRDHIVRGVSVHPGHLGASLGVVELTVALLRVYDPLVDRIIWDVGHQAYPYKILTNRYEAFSTNRQFCGMSGFPSRAESRSDAFGTGHSSTSISAALGMAIGARQQGLTNKVVAVIGDGALTGGMAYEALNNAGGSREDMLVVLNDNDMSIDPNVGAMRNYLVDIATSSAYNTIKDRMWRFVESMPAPAGRLLKTAQLVDRGLKGMLLKEGNLFESMGFRYFGPIDGHDLPHLLKVVKGLHDLPGPRLLHIRTQKGKGYPPAERNQTVWHAPGPFDPATGERSSSSTTPVAPKYQDVFGEALVRLAGNYPRVVGITAAMLSGTSLSKLQEAFPERTFDVGIAEQHAVTFAAGQAVMGTIPFCAIYSSFLQRALDQVIHDVAIQNLHVVFCLDRAGLVGEDGSTHHGVFDISYLRGIPNLTICSPRDEYELPAMMEAALVGCGPWVIRYPRGRGIGETAKHEPQGIRTHRAEWLRKGGSYAILSIGPMAWHAAEALDILSKEGIEGAHLDMRFIKPLDEAALHEVMKGYERIYTLEDGVLAGGFGSAVLEWLSDHGYRGTVVRIGLPDRFITHGTPKQLYQLEGLDPKSIARRIARDLRGE